MTTPIVPSISDEQLAEIERFLSFGGSMLKVKSDALRGLIARLRAAEADAKRYRWLIHNWRVQEVIDVVLDDNSDTVDAYGPLIDASMERTP